LRKVSNRHADNITAYEIGGQCAWGQTRQKAVKAHGKLPTQEGAAGSADGNREHRAPRHFDRVFRVLWARRLPTDSVIDEALQSEVSLD
jgi:hypothetical protein